MAKPSNNQITDEILTEMKPRLHFVYVKEWGSLLMRRDKEMIYKVVDSEFLERLIRQHITITYPEVRITMALLTDVVKQMAVGCEDVIEDDVPDRYFAFSDTLYDFEKFQPVEFKPDRIAVFGTDVAYADLAGAESPMFDKYLETTFIDRDTGVHDPTLVALLQEMVGNVFSPSMEGAGAFFLTGEGKNGKSVILDTIKNIVGKRFCTAFSIEALTTNRFATSSLVGKKLNVCAEEESKHMKADKFKSLVTGDMTTAERKFGGTFEFKPTTKFIFATNATPTFDGLSYGTRRRIKIIPFYNAFEGTKKIGGLSKQLTQERAGIIRWAIEGAKRLAANNFEFSVDQSPAAIREMEAFEADSSNAVRYIRSEGYEYNEGVYSTTDAIYSDYKEWTLKNGFKQMSSNTFFKDFNRLFPKSPSFLKKIEGKVVRCYHVARKVEDPDSSSSANQSGFPVESYGF